MLKRHSKQLKVLIKDEVLYYKTPTEKFKVTAGNVKFVRSLTILDEVNSYFEKGCRKKRTQKSRKVLWVVLSSLFLEFSI